MVVIITLAVIAGGIVRAGAALVGVRGTVPAMGVVDRDLFSMGVVMVVFVTICLTARWLARRVGVEIHMF